MIRNLLLTAATLSFLAPAAVRAADAPAEPLAPQAAVKAIKLPEGFKATLFAAEPDVVQPIGFTFDDRGRVWVAECVSYPNWDKSARPDSKGKDRIVVLEDTDHDGSFDKRTVFADDLCNLSGLELGFGGVFVCGMPYFKFIPADFNADEPKPSGPARVLLDGWDIEHAGHNVFGNLNWGPDGWLWGLSGIQSKNVVGKPGSAEADRVKFDCGVWRYHPTKAQFEVVTWGTVNPFGLDFDANGQAFITNCVLEHVFHAIPGAHYKRMYGQDPVASIYQPMLSCADHIHWGGGDWTSSRGGQGKHSDAGGGHAHVGAMIYLGENFPPEYRGGLFTMNLHGGRANHDFLEQSGSGFVARHGKDFLFAGDPWFRATAIKSGADGGVYITDWSDTGECHNYKVVDRRNGRLFKITYGKPEARAGDLSKATDDALLQAALGTSEWTARHARRLLQERAANGSLRRSQFENATLKASPSSLPALWTANAIGSIDESITLALTKSDDAYMRGWAVRIELDDKLASDTFLAKLAELAQSDPSPVVRLHLASVLQRLPNEKRWGIAAGLLSHAEDAKDANLPLMIWYGIESAVGVDGSNAVALLKQAKLPLVRGFIAQRLASDAAPLVKLLGETKDLDLQRDILRGLNAAYAGKGTVAMPDGWSAAFSKVNGSKWRDIREAGIVLALAYADPAAIPLLRKTAVDAKEDAAARASANKLLAEAKDPRIVAMLHDLLGDAAVRGAAIRALAAANDAQTPTRIIAKYATLTSEEKRDAIQTLSSRPPFAAALLDAVEAGTVPRGDLSTLDVRQISELKDDALSKRLAKVWGTIRTTTGDRATLIAKYKTDFAPEKLADANLSHGRSVFSKTCAQCHTLFDAGGKLGPNLTGGQRATLDYILENVVDPNAAVAKDFQMAIVATRDGRTVNGILLSESEDRVVIRTVTEDVTVPAGDVRTRRVSPYSMMPEGLLDALKPDEQRDLIAYLASKSQVPLEASPAGDR
jgi:putative membrane-bound dehydrogenase-like protein